jgi:prepilin-type N-terminal cleavage/methylation domain-containing protein
VAAVSDCPGFASASRHRGTTLVELLVVLALVSVMVLVAAQLVIHSVQLQGAVGMSIKNPLTSHVTGRLRNDIQGSMLVVEERDIWEDGPLVLKTRNSRLVSFRKVDDTLVRKTSMLDETVLEERVLMRGLTSWWWRCPVPGTVDLRYAYLINAGSESANARRAGYAGERRTEQLRFAIRGWGAEAGW